MLLKNDPFIFSRQNQYLCDHRSIQDGHQRTKENWTNSVLASDGLWFLPLWTVRAPYSVALRDVFLFLPSFSQSVWFNQFQLYILLHAESCTKSHSCREWLSRPGLGWAHRPGWKLGYKVIPGLSMYKYGHLAPKRRMSAKFPWYLINLAVSSWKTWCYLISSLRVSSATARLCGAPWKSGFSED